MKITCKNGGEHSTVNGAKYCDLPVNWHAPTPPPPPSVPAPRRPHVTHTSAEPTDAQRAYIDRLGGTMPTGCTRLQASQIIESLKKAAAEAPTPTPKESVMQITKLGVPAEMLFDIREGRFAVSPNGGPLDFVRISLIKPRRGMSWKMQRHVGSLKVQTQHSGDLIDRAFISPQGGVLLLSRTMGTDRLRGILLAIIVDQKAAAIKFGRELGECCRCGKTLTDERSRYFGIGPECETHWPEIIGEVEAELGAFVPSRELV